MEKLRFGIIGIGNMGSAHARSLLQGNIKGAVLTAMADTNPERMTSFEEVERFSSADELFRSGLVDAVIIATPHYDHTTLSIAALDAGLHVVVEKPIAVHKADAGKMLAAHGKHSKLVFAAMFNQRTDPFYQKIRQLVQSGELGEIRRINWIITSWFRTEAYYASGGWRATWAGEGGGVLLNQCPHNLDLFQWMFGMPDRVRAFCTLGRYHDIEVEDDVTAYMEYNNGTHALFVTSTGEAPGTNRLEITAERGRLVYENDSLDFQRNVIPMSEFSRTTTKAFARPESWDVSIPVNGHGGQHNEILQNFVDTVQGRSQLIAPARDGIHSVELANAMLYSSMTDKMVELPLDAKAYERKLKKLTAGSRYKEKLSAPPKGEAATSDLSQSFS